MLSNPGGDESQMKVRKAATKRRRGRLHDEISTVFHPQGTLEIGIIKSMCSHCVLSKFFVTDYKTSYKSVSRRSAREGKSF